MFIVFAGPDRRHSKPGDTSRQLRHDAERLATLPQRVTVRDVTHDDASGHKLQGLDHINVRVVIHLQYKYHESTYHKVCNQSWEF